MWERGLKPGGMLIIKKKHCVAPHVGAWIETHSQRHYRHEGGSLPMWERGLKPLDVRRLDRVA